MLPYRIASILDFVSQYYVPPNYRYPHLSMLHKDLPFWLCNIYCEVEE